ncbi:hypothetical protein P2P32_24535, partial [Escherichia coli]
EWVHVQLHQQKGMISLSPPTICNSANDKAVAFTGTVTSAFQVTTKADFVAVVFYFSFDCGHFCSLFWLVV